MRDQVQRWLSACVVAGHDTPDGDNAHVAFEVDAPTLEALCRRWLAVEAAEATYVEPKNGLAVLHERTMPLALMNKRVRIVPDQGEGE